MEEANLPYKPLVGFSGTIKDLEVDAQYTENGLNQLPPRVDIPDAFKMPEYRILVVANKFQTGFDEPLLYAMYVDKKLGGVTAVQTLSRLNRTTRGKEDCMVLDFTNEAKEIQTAFQPYYQNTLLEDTPDPDRLYDQKDDILKHEIFSEQDVEEFAACFWSVSYGKDNDTETLQPILDRARDNWRQQDEEEREDFRGKLQSFNRLYGFLSQVISFQDVDLEKFYAYVRLLNRKLDPRESGKLPKDLLKAVKLDSLRIDRTSKASIPLVKEDGALDGIGDGDSGGYQTEETDSLTNIVKRLNDLHGLNLTDEDKVDMETIRKRIDESAELLSVMTANNSEQTKQEKFVDVFNQTLLDFIHTKLDLYKKIKEPDIEPAVIDMLYEEYRKRLNELEDS